jgi:hypothetical protein
MEQIKFNHDGGTLAEAMCIDPERKLELEGIVLYNMIIVEIMSQKLFGSKEKAPRNLTTKSGVLEKVLDYAENLTEAVYITYEYCSVDIRTNSDAGIEGKMFCTGIAMKIKQLDLDEDKFIEWYSSQRRKASKEASK